MTSVKVAVRVRPLNQREDGSNCIIEMAGEKTRIINPKVPDTGSEGDHAREQFKTREFTFDHSFWSACPTDPNFVTQEQVFAALGVDVVTSAYEGYNVCVFAYGQTGSGKTYTMMGNQEDPGLIPRFCEEMFSRMRDQNATHKTQVSYLEIYNEKVRDLLKHNSNSKPSHKLRIREHPKEGPYVQDLSEHTVVSYEGIASLMNKGNNNRTTAATLMNDVSSRSHAIFTITFTQAKFLDGLPSERQSKIHLVDLAGSERADASGATGQRLKEGGSINKSLVTLGNVISVLAEISEEKGNRSRGTFIPYRDSVLTWLLKDSLGGNAKTIMIATISPSSLNYAETLSTLRYANRAKNIINRPTVNEDPNVRLIRELREEIARLKSLLGGNLDNISSPKVQEKLHENEARIKVLTEEWADKWRESASILQMEKNLELRKEGLGVVLDSTLPHLIGIDDDILSTGIMLYHLKEGITTIGSEESEEPQDICISGAEVEDQHCVIEYRNGNVTLHPIEDALCCVNGSVVTEPVNLTQGAVVVLGRTNMFRFNHPAEAQKLKQMRKSLSTLSLSRSPVLSNSRTSLLSHSMTDLYRSHDSLPLTAGWEFEESHREEQEVIDVKQQEIEELELKHKQREEEWQKQQAILDQQLQAKQQQLSALEHEMESLQETVSPAKSLEEALQRLEQQEASKLLEMQHFREELLQELKVQSLSLEKNKTGLAESICELDKQIANGCTVLFSMQEEVVNKRSALQENRMKEEEQIAILRSELTSIREELALEREKILSHDSELAKQYTALTEEEANLRKQLDHLDHSKNAEWKKILDSLSEENYRIEEAWHDISEQETEVKHKLEGGLFADSQEKEELEKYKQELEKARLLLKEEEDRVATAQQKEMEHIEAEMEKWAQYKEQEINSMQRKRDSVLRKQSQKMDILCAQSEDKLSAITLKQEQCHEIDMSLEAFSRKIQSELSVKQEIDTSLEAFSRKIQSELSVKQEHQKQLEELKEQRTRELSKSEKDGITLKKEFDAKLEQLKMSYERDIKSIQEEKERLLILRRPTKELLEQQQALDLKVQECESLREEINTLKEELLAHEHQQEDALDHELDDIEFKKLQLQELVHQERINALVEQEVKRRLFEEKVEREKQRRIEREKDRQERDKEIRSLKSVHEREMRQLRAKFENSNGHSVSNPYGVTVTPLSTFEDNRKKLVRQLSSTGPPPSINITIPNYELRGTGRDAHYEYEVKIKIGDETWSVFRRYSRFRELHQNMRKKYPAVDILVFPPRKLFHRTERVASERRVMLEQYLSNLLEVCMRCPDSPLQNQYLSKHVLAEFDQFFHRGLFEHARHIAT